MSIAVDPSQWRESDLYEEITINKSKALAQYKLREKDLDGLDFHVGKILNYKGFKVDTYLYKEIEVERRAWERYGGPEAFEAVLQKKHEEHQQKPRPRKNFQQPSQYARGALKRKLGARKAARTDPYIKRSRALWQIRDAMPRWLWDACNAALDVHNTPPPPGDDVQVGASTSKKGKAKGTAKFKPLFDTDKKREAALRLAFALPMARTNAYATRPIPDPGDSAPGAGAAQSSPEWCCLFEVLDGAPRLPAALGEQGEGLTMQVAGGTQAGSATYLYEWDASYLDQLHDALSAVVRAHGGGLQEGWAAAKWAVYDVFAERMSGLEFVLSDDKGNGTWTDPAAGWLAEGYAASGFRCDAMPRVQVPKSL
ncbi:hypothetical protein GSI_02751 [Ganoderma sinense ZZ0214-1]|uniref:Uncharacterized protein n=1 Tax=Ganoderma sinense ZZ0214-1 TaxID=1077348 RepID=A0A2G8SMG5_9APHY|nr:hypothetical protein GSI_02751 [Ganoderma sinense ZZ0214-1]